MADSNLSPQKSIPQNHTNPNKYFNQFLLKAAIATIFLVLLPLFPSEAPDFITQALHNRSWEFLQLVFVGIAISYGLFSRRNDDESEKDHASKLDNVHSYMSTFLPVSSVFDDETETRSETPIRSDENRVQTWNSRYYRGEPTVVVADQEGGGTIIEEHRITNPKIAEKPLLLPVRSLKFGSNSNLNPEGFTGNSNLSRNGDFGCLDGGNLVEKVKENVVLPSPIPWRSRSGRFEMREEFDGSTPSIGEFESNRFMRHPSTKPNSLSPSPSLNSPRKSSSSPSLSPEFQAKIAEDPVRKKIHHHKSSLPPAPPPPPPPPPPLPPIQKSHLIKSNSYGVDFGNRELRRTHRSVPKDLNGNGTDELQNRGGYLGTESKSRNTQIDVPLMGKSVRSVSSAAAIKTREFGEEGDEEDRNLIEKKGRLTKRVVNESVGIVSNPSFYDKVIVETDDDDDDDDDDEDEDSEISDNEFHEEIADRNLRNEEKEEEENGSNDLGPDVDKKADEFIAKFREQIRLQRIQSIKRSTGQLSRNSNSSR